MAVFWPLLACSWRLLGRFGPFSGRIGRSWGGLGTSWGGLWAHADPSQEVHIIICTFWVLTCQPLGSLLGLSWRFFGRSWGALGGSWAAFGRSRAVLGGLGSFPKRPPQRKEVGRTCFEPSSPQRPSKNKSGQNMFPTTLFVLVIVLVFLGRLLAYWLERLLL